MDSSRKENQSLVHVSINGRDYEVPAGSTMVQAMWYTGHEVIHGIGCLGGVCGACATVYRMKGDFRLRNALACQTLVQDGMSFSMLDSYPIQRAHYDVAALTDPKEELFTFYPESGTLRNCNACTEVCPQGIDVRDSVWRANFGDFNAVHLTDDELCHVWSLRLTVHCRNGPPRNRPLCQESLWGKGTSLSVKPEITVGRDRGRYFFSGDGAPPEPVTG
ncbi:MAG: Ferredoxin [Leptospirillum sp. Group IV 'UBA BS']|nr:MAG: Ferredoxin [Leptospirillum sp. Group IV 'UBA BS']